MIVFISKNNCILQVAFVSHYLTLTKLTGWLKKSLFSIHMFAVKLLAPNEAFCF